MDPTTTSSLTWEPFWPHGPETSVPCPETLGLLGVTSKRVSTAARTWPGKSASPHRPETPLPHPETLEDLNWRNPSALSSTRTWGSARNIKLTKQTKITAEVWKLTVVGTTAHKSTPGPKDKLNRVTAW